jgi:hypothetical protein
MMMATPKREPTMAPLAPNHVPTEGTKTDTTETTEVIKPRITCLDCHGALTGSINFSLLAELLHFRFIFNDLNGHHTIQFIEVPNTLQLYLMLLNLRFNKVPFGDSGNNTTPYCYQANNYRNQY